MKVEKKEKNFCEAGNEGSEENEERIRFVLFVIG